MTPGIEIGSYMLEELLERGRRGEVWLAYRELATGGRTTVVVRFPYATSELARDDIHDEARLHLQHSNIPRIIDTGLHEGQPYFVTDYIAGRSLEELLVSLRVFGTPLGFELVAHIAREIGHALRYAHGFTLDGVSRPVLHGDVAPHNVLLSSGGAIYVTNFGGSETAGVAGSVFKSSLVYKSPEHALGFPTPKSDGWALGAILWEMLEGLPFRAEVGADSLLRTAKEGRHEPLTREATPQVLQQVTEGLLTVDIHGRLALDEALRLLEAPEFPVQRMALADIVAECFGDALDRRGRARPSVHPDPSLAVARALEDDGPFGLNTWSREPEDESLPPPPAWASMSSEDASAEPEPEPTQAPSPSPIEAPPPTEASEASSTEEPRPVAAPAPDAAPRKAWSVAMLVPVLGLVIVGIAWAVWPRGAEQQALRPSAPASAEGPRDRSATEPPPAPTDAPEAAPIPEPPPSDTATHEPVDPEPAETKAPEAPPLAEPKPIAEPIAEPVAEPKPVADAKPKASTQPAPKTKKVSGPPAQLAIELKLMADMDLKINGTLFSLGVRRTSAKTSVAPGKVRVQWRRPMGQWKSKSFVVEPGVSYWVRLDDRGPTFKKKA